MSGRLADSLLYLSDEIFQTKSFEMPLSNKDLAELSGMSKDNVVRNLKHFHRKGYIDYSERQIEITDYTSLQLLSQEG